MISASAHGAREEACGLRQRIIDGTKLLQITREVRATLIAIVRVLRNCARNNSVEPGWYFVLKTGDRHRLDVHHFETDSLSAVALEWTKARDHAVEHHSKRE